MTKRLNQINAYFITGEVGAYYVTLERLHNTPSGTPRFKAVIITVETDEKGKIKLVDGNSHYNAVYTFTGHYLSERQEAYYIVAEYEKPIIEKENKAVVDYLLKKEQ